MSAENQTYQETPRIPLIGETAPSFRAQTTQGEIDFPEQDMLDDTPLPDTKPCVPEYDAHPSATAGWLEECGVDRRVADGRFHPPVDSTRGGRR